MNTIIDHKKITIYPSEVENAPIVYSNDFEDTAKKLLEECKNLDCKPFHLVSITNLKWDEELSPWKCEAVVSKEDRFEGKAADYLAILEQEMIPWVKSKLGKSEKNILAGYSMAGLFALYAATQSEQFDAYLSASGSLWFPNFVQYIKNTEWKQKPQAIYLSLGDRESRTRNEYLSTTENCTRELLEYVQSQNISSIFELNPGNHFKNPERRVAKGITWVLNTMSE